MNDALMKRMARDGAALASEHRWDPAHGPRAASHVISPAFVPVPVPACLFSLVTAWDVAAACLLLLTCVSSLVAAPLTFTQEGRAMGRVMALATLGDRVIAGTDHGLWVRETSGHWTPLQGTERLPHQGVLSLVADEASGDLWVGTLRGLARVSAGRVEIWTQFSSGLANDIVYGLALQPPYVWAATAAGLSRFDPATGHWWIFNEKNTPMREVWNYSVAVGPDRVWAGIWGSGVLEYYISEDRWKLYTDADHEEEIVLLKDAGPIHDVTSAVATDGPVVWQSTYFGLSRYDGRRWKNFMAKEGGLPSDFIVSIKVHDHVLWACTDKGLASFRSGSWERFLSGTSVLSVGFLGDAILAGTYEGVEVGRPASARDAGTALAPATARTRAAPRDDAPLTGVQGAASR